MSKRRGFGGRGDAMCLFESIQQIKPPIDRSTCRLAVAERLSLDIDDERYTEVLTVSPAIELSETSSMQNYSMIQEDGNAEGGQDEAQASSSAPSKGQKGKKRSLLPYTPAFVLNDVVYGTVCLSNMKGYRVDIMYHQQLQGFMPIDQSPMTPAEMLERRWRSKEERHPVKSNELLVKGHTRPFKVIGIPPEGMEAMGRGPLLSAMHYDKDMLWARVSQLHQLGLEEEREGKGSVSFSVKVHSFNSGGLITSVMGLEAFVPNSHISRREGLTLDHAVEKILGTEIEVVMIEFTPFRAIKLSETIAKTQKLTIPGAVVRGIVVHMVQYGAFLKVDGLVDDVLLHNSSISGERVRHASEVFEVGEEVLAVVLPCSDDQRVRVSTSLLEAEAGEMLRKGGKQQVMERAASRYL